MYICSRCEIEEEPEDEDEALNGPTYQKTFKKKEWVITSTISKFIQRLQGQQRFLANWKFCIYSDTSSTPFSKTRN